MVDRGDCTFELFDSSVFVEAIADTSGKQDVAKSLINSVIAADNRVPVVHELIVGEVKGFLDSDFFETDVSREMAADRFESYINDFSFIEIDLESFRDELSFILDEKGRIASEFNDSLIVAIGLSTDRIDKIHTRDQDWNLKEKGTKINSI